MLCKNCGREIAEGNDYCSDCNMKFEDISKAVSDINNSLVENADTTVPISDVELDAKQSETAEMKENEKVVATKEIPVKRIKKTHIISSLAVAISLILIVLIIKCYVIPNNKYNDAMNMYDNKEYEHAITAFKNLDNFKNSEDMIARINQETYDALLNQLTDLGKEQKWDDMKSVIQNKESYIPDSEVLDEIDNTITQIQKSEISLQELQEKEEKFQTIYDDNKDELDERKDQLEDAKNTMDTLYQEYNDLQLRYDMESQIINMDFYMIQYLDTYEDDVYYQSYEVCPASYDYYGDPYTTEDRALLYTGYTEYNSKGWTNIDVIYLYDEEVKLKEDLGGFNQTWPVYMEASYFIDTYGVEDQNYIQEAKDSYDDAYNTYTEMEDSIKTLSDELAEDKKNLSSAQADYQAAKEEYDKESIKLINKIYELLGIDLISTQEDKLL